MTHEKHKRRRRQNPVEHRADGTSVLELSHGNAPVFCIIDTVDYDTLKNYCWYFRRYVRAATPAGSQVRMSALLLPGGANYKNRDYLDHRRCNLRPATRSQMVAGTKKRVSRTKEYSSIFKGVIRRGHRWKAKLCELHLGYFTNESDAARAFDAAALQLYGDYAHLNFPAASS